MNKYMYFLILLVIIFVLVLVFTKKSKNKKNKNNKNETFRFIPGPVNISNPTLESDIIGFCVDTESNPKTVYINAKNRLYSCPADIIDGGVLLNNYTLFKFPNRDYGRYIISYFSANFNNTVRVEKTGIPFIIKLDGIKYVAIPCDYTDISNVNNPIRSQKGFYLVNTTNMTPNFIKIGCQYGSPVLFSPVQDMKCAIFHNARDIRGNAGGEYSIVNPVIGVLSNSNIVSYRAMNPPAFSPSPYPYLTGPASQPGNIINGNFGENTSIFKYIEPYYVIVNNVSSLASTPAGVINGFNRNISIQFFRYDKNSNSLIKHNRIYYGNAAYQMAPVSEIIIDNNKLSQYGLNSYYNLIDLYFEVKIKELNFNQTTYYIDKIFLLFQVPNLGSLLIPNVNFKEYAFRRIDEFGNQS